ncbi:cobalt ECF transporter T component CbiQ [Aestuariirhabdus litorea]|uniref:Cobalt ECF transporter T component CbiQ n=1 Tax=Aestuariirhabdus litorea TaxID=2528527 RepID=A0A3P3VL31_9GAMM|nr:cobalt ECF transporter T component CbiQ [Aestuariirhabdus litorea]RRJ83027.1 cobalt ECF transporter T component CbiQ [Aestuariirhabdus litorea]RWW93185.1 cobalt ECF transporter T component CbiQ [Endozoicomonadaceae bacterium GTF-13]
MSLSLQLRAEAELNPWLARLDPRARLLLALLFAATVVSLQQPLTLLVALGGALALALASGLRPALLLKRLLALEGFMLVLVLMLPFSVPGEPLFQLGPLSASGAGLERALVILLKANAVVVALLTLAGTLEPIVFGHALARLGVPDKLVHLLLFTLRYVDLLFAEYQRLRLAMRARAFAPASNGHTWRSYGYLIGMLLVRSLERAQRIQAAMKCRGFNNRLLLVDASRWQGADSRFLLLATLGLAALLLLERWQ